MAKKKCASTKAGVGKPETQPKMKKTKAKKK
jgi:hypothetical protein